MSLLTDVIGGVLRESSGGSAMQGVLHNLLGGGQAQAQSSPGAAAGAGVGGLSGLISAFERAGLGHIVQSWISPGPNQPVSTDQLRHVLGGERVDAMAQQAGMEPQGFLAQLSQHLPKAVDRVTPEGKLPDDGSVSV
jgi:uncharacterized protein YidB (DUF937 family)